jgi:hypothetical protein
MWSCCKKFEEWRGRNNLANIWENDGSMYTLLANLDHPVRILAIIAFIIGVHLSVILVGKRRF